MATAAWSGKITLAMNAKTKTKLSQPAASSPSSPLLEFALRQRVAKAATPQSQIAGPTDNFSKSRDLHENRGARPLKTTPHANTSPLGR